MENIKVSKMLINDENQKKKTSDIKYTDEQLNNIIKKEKLKLVKLLGFDDIQTAKKTVTQYPKIIQQAKISKEFFSEFIKCKGNLFEAQQMLLAYMQKEIALKNGVQEQFVDLVISEVNYQIFSEFIFEDILKYFISKNPIYLSQQNISGGAPND